MFISSLCQNALRPYSSLGFNNAEVELETQESTPSEFQIKAVTILL